MRPDTLPTIKATAEQAGSEADMAILHSELPGDHPTLSALKAARIALDKIKIAAELDDVPPMDVGQL